MKRSPLPPRSTPLRRKPFKVRAGAKADTVRARKRSGMDAARRESFGRSGGLCVLNGCENVATHAHHRKLRSQGGDDSPANLLPLCSGCHADVHANPDWAKRYELIVPAWDVVTPWWLLPWWTERRAS